MDWSLQVQEFGPLFSVYCYQQCYIWLYWLIFLCDLQVLNSPFFHVYIIRAYVFHSETAMWLNSSYFVLYYTLTIIYTTDLDISRSHSTVGEGLRNNFPSGQAIHFIPVGQCAPSTMARTKGSDIWAGSTAAQQSWLHVYLCLAYGIRFLQSIHSPDWSGRERSNRHRARWTNSYCSAVWIIPPLKEKHTYLIHNLKNWWRDKD